MLTTVRRVHRGLVDRIAAATGLTGEPLQNRSLHNHALRNQRLCGHEDPSRRRVLVAWQARIDAGVRGAGR